MTTPTKHNDVEYLTWNCPNCGAKHLQGDICPYCGTLKDTPGQVPRWKSTTPKLEPTPEPSLQSLAPMPGAYGLGDKQPFLLRESHRDLVEGRARGLQTTWANYFGLVFLIFMAGLITVVALPDYLLMRALDARGLPAQAQITNRYTTSGKSTSYHLVFAHQIAGKSYSSTETVSRASYSSHPLATMVQIRYLKEDPSQARLAGPDRDDGDTPFTLVIIIGFWIVAVIYLLLLVNNMLRNRQLTTTGRLIRGVIVGSSLNRTKNGRALTVRYEFQSPQSGKLLHRKENAMRTDLRHKGPPAPGTPVVVIYADDRTYRML